MAFIMRQTTIHTALQRLSIAAVLLISPLLMQAQQIKADASTDHAMTGEPIFSHALYYTGMVEYDGEMIPSFMYSDFYVFRPLIFKNAAQARKYYKIANNIKKVYPIACEIQQTVNRTIAHMDSLPTKREKDAYLKQQEKELKAQYYPRLKKLTFAQGKLLIKLIDRQCDMTGYELITSRNTWAALRQASTTHSPLFLAQALKRSMTRKWTTASPNGQSCSLKVDNYEKAENYRNGTHERRRVPRFSKDAPHRRA